jgi:hypothetical protein
VQSLSEVLRKYAEQSPQELVPAVDEIWQHGYISEYLHSFGHGRTPRYVDESPVAYRHPNGFTKIRLASLSDYGWAVRLHVWDRKSSDCDIHSHRWNFASRILAGTLTEETYELAIGTGEYAAYHCAPSVAGRYSLEFRQNCDVRLINRDQYGRGASYHRDAETLHMAYISSASQGVTLFIQGSERASSTRVIRRSTSNTEKNLVYPKLNITELTELFQEIVSITARA